MSENRYSYLIIGGGLAGASAVEGIREIDGNGSILMIGSEKHLPYDRPHLSKKLWLGKKKVEEIFFHDRKFYDQNGAELALGIKVTALDVREKTVTDDKGKSFHYGKLLLATGGEPRSLSIQGGDLEGLYYYRKLDDYLRMRGEAVEGNSAVIIGGGFIGSEMAAALHIHKLLVTMIFPEAYIVRRVFPDYLGLAIQQRYKDRGINILAEDIPSALMKRRKKFIIRTKNGKEIESDIVIVGIGIVPSMELASRAGLTTGNGVEVNEYLQTSNPDIYAAGDNALFPYQALNQRVRIEHWDNAINQGRWAGRNMAGAQEPFTYMPYFFSDLFEFGYEAVGEVNSELETFPDWKKEYDTGVIYYMKDRKVRGAMMCNVWDKVEAARDLIRRARPMPPSDLRGAL